MNTDGLMLRTETFNRFAFLFWGGKKKIIYNNLKKVRDFYHNMPIVI